jgi:hypothetical protein
MLRFSLRAALATLVLAAVAFRPAAAQDASPELATPAPLPDAGAARPVQFDGAVPNAPIATQAVPATTAAPDPAQLPVVNEQPGYVYLNAPLYPSPLPNIPHQVGSTMITNQALAPHEMLYAHRYRAIYPPYYYVVTRGGLLCQHDHWHLVGTEVKVKYSSSYGMWSGFHPPSNRSSLKTPIYHEYR